MLSLLDLEIDVRLPQYLRHIQLRLADGQLKYGSRTFYITQDCFQFRILKYEKWWSLLN